MANRLKSILTGFACAASGAVLMWAGTTYQDHATQDEIAEKLATGFVRTKLFLEFPEFKPHERTLVDTVKNSIVRQDAIVCKAGQQNICFIDDIHQRPVLLDIVGKSLEICRQQPSLEQSCQYLAEWVDREFQREKSREPVEDILSRHRTHKAQLTGPAIT